MRNDHEKMLRNLRDSIAIAENNKEKTIKKSLLKKERKKLVVRMSKKSPTRKKSKKIVVRQFEAPSILAKTLELMETKFSQNNPTIRNALQRK